MQPIQDIDRANLEDVTGGVDIGGIASMIGGLVDKFANTGGKGSQIASTIGTIAQQFQGGGDAGASGGA